MGVHLVQENVKQILPVMWYCLELEKSEPQGLSHSLRNSKQDRMEGKQRSASSGSGRDDGSGESRSSKQSHEHQFVWTGTTLTAALMSEFIAGEGMFKVGGRLASR
jgi:hypothetical protein